MSNTVLDSFLRIRYEFKRLNLEPPDLVVPPETFSHLRFALKSDIGFCLEGPDEMRLFGMNVKERECS